VASAGDFLIWGSSGHGKVLADVIALCGGRVVALVDNDPNANPCVPGLKVHTGERGLREVGAGDRSPAQSAAVAIGGARGADRRGIASLLRSLGYSLPPIVHPTAAIAASARISDGSHILAQTVVAADATVGSMVIVNNGAVVDHECILEDGVHIAPGATLCGCVMVGQDAMIGAGATVLPRVTIGRGAVVGAGATVTRDVAAGTTAIGVPARQLPRR
jgi:sugar O-acyltransferase (sialic acid O-acetyltransferase NeuD family)